MNRGKIPAPRGLQVDVARTEVGAKNLQLCFHLGLAQGERSIDDVPDALGSAEMKGRTRTRRLFGLNRISVG